MTQSRIYAVEKADLGTPIVQPDTPPAISISAIGTVATSGWTHPALTPWAYITAPADGMLDLDFVASPPTGLALMVISTISVGKTILLPDWVRGVRIHASRNQIEAKLDEAAVAAVKSTNSANWPLPWPFPFWAPKATK